MVQDCNILGHMNLIHKTLPFLTSPSVYSLFSFLVTQLILHSWVTCVQFLESLWPLSCLLYTLSASHYIFCSTDCYRAMSMFGAKESPTSHTTPPTLQKPITALMSCRWYHRQCLGWIGVLNRFGEIWMKLCFMEQWKFQYDLFSTIYIYIYKYIYICIHKHIHICVYIYTRGRTD
jgi:hypothetical protein